MLAIDVVALLGVLSWFVWEPTQRVCPDGHSKAIESPSLSRCNVPGNRVDGTRVAA
jgi:hypothetical protein